MFFAAEVKVPVIRDDFLTKLLHAILIVSVFDFNENREAKGAVRRDSQSISDEK